MAILMLQYDVTQSLKQPYMQLDLKEKCLHGIRAKSLNAIEVVTLTFDCFFSKTWPQGFKIRKYLTWH